MVVMQTETIVTTLLTAAACLKEPATSVASQAMKDLYDATKYYLRRKFGTLPDAAKALDSALEKPTSEARRAVLLEESRPAGLESDFELERVIKQLAALLAEMRAFYPAAVHVEGTGNQVQVAGRDIITTTRHVQRSTIQPDERHLTGEQVAQLRSVIGEVAARLGGEGSGSPHGIVHRMLQRRYRVPSYHLIPRERFADALAYLKRERAIRRGALRQRDPVAYRKDFFRAIFARAGELGWDRMAIYQFAFARLRLKTRPNSLQELGATQLRALAERMRREPASRTGRVLSPFR